MSAQSQEQGICELTLQGSIVRDYFNADPLAQPGAGPNLEVIITANQNPQTDRDDQAPIGEGHHIAVVK